jgi:hypothetical protein
MRYSHHHAEPAPLPHRIRFQDGSTRTDASTFTPEELERAGYTGPYERPECDPKTETVQWDAEALAFIVRPYSDTEIAEQRARVREQYIIMLKASDWTQITDYDLGADRASWATYRQALRDLADAPNPFDITWPHPPTLEPSKSEPKA